MLIALNGNHFVLFRTTKNKYKNNEQNTPKNIYYAYRNMVKS